MSTSDRQKYKIAGSATWELIRAAYLAGDSAPALAERYGVSEYAIRKRITVERWTKREYAAALEARGLEAPKRTPLNVASRFAVSAASPERAPDPEHPFMELVGALKQASDALEARKPAEPEVSQPAEAPQHQTQGDADALELEELALNSLSKALAKGNASEARALVSVADAMRKRAAEDVGLRGFKEREYAKQCNFAAFLAYCVVYNPKEAPEMFVDFVAEGRKALFGEGDEEALRRAANRAREARRYFNLSEAAWEQAMAELLERGRRQGPIGGPIPPGVASPPVERKLLD